MSVCRGQTWLQIPKMDNAESFVVHRSKRFCWRLSPLILASPCSCVSNLLKHLSCRILSIPSVGAASQPRKARPYGSGHCRLAIAQLVKHSGIRWHWCCVGGVCIVYGTAPCFV